MILWFNIHRQDSWYTYSIDIKAVWILITRCLERCFLMIDVEVGIGERFESLLLRMNLQRRLIDNHVLGVEHDLIAAAEIHDSFSQFKTFQLIILVWWFWCELGVMHLPDLHEKLNLFFGCVIFELLLCSSLALPLRSLAHIKVMSAQGIFISWWFMYDPLKIHMSCHKI